MDITYQPGQAVPAGNYIVILRPVTDDETPINMPTPSAPVMDIPEYPPATVPDEVYPPATVPSEGSGSGLANVGPAASLANVGPGNNNSMNMNNSSTNNIGMQGGRKKMSKMTKKAKKSKGTRKLSPYMKFAQQVRPQIIKNNPNLKSDIIGVGRKIGEMWRGLSDAEKAKY